MKIEYLTPETVILTELGRRLARMRKQQGISQTQLAKEAGIGVATLRRIEAGQDSQMATWIKIMKSLRMTNSINTLLPETFNSPMAEVLAEKKSTKRTRQDHPPIFWGDQKI